MKLSTKGRYGARAAIELALRYGSGPIMVREIAANQKISDRYLEHILTSLRSAGLVKSTRGAKGGYELAKSPQDIRLGEIIRALEGPIDIVPCTSDQDCENITQCIMIEVWTDVKEAIEGVLDSVTLDELLRRQKKLKDTEAYQYVI